MQKNDTSRAQRSTKVVSRRRIFLISLIIFDTLALLLVLSGLYWLFTLPKGSDETPEQADKSPSFSIRTDALNNTDSKVANIVSGLEQGQMIDLDDRFSKLDERGQPLEKFARTWRCVKDEQEGLLWEVKGVGGGWQDAEQTYSWFAEDEQGAQTGRHNAGVCLFIDCDTSAYIVRMNQQQICGVNNWRLPTQTELQSLDHPINFSPDIHADFFPNTQSGQYWSASENPYSQELAWSVDFANGIAYVGEKRLPHFVRLVSSIED